MEQYNQSQMNLQNAFEEAEETVEVETKSQKSGLNIDIEDDREEISGEEEEEETESIFNSSSTALKTKSKSQENLEIVENDGENIEQTQAQMTKQSEEFWDYNKKVEEQLRCYAEGEALNNLFDDKDEEKRLLLEKKKEQTKLLESEIMSFWPTVPKIEPVPEPVVNTAPEVIIEEGDSNISAQTSNIPATQIPVEQQAKVIIEAPVVTETVTEPATDMFAFMNKSKKPKNKKPWLR